MSNNDDAKKTEKREALKGVIREVVKEEIEAAFSSAVVPKGYERCPACGELKKIGKKCPYCENKSDDKKDDVFGDLV